MDRVWATRPPTLPGQVVPNDQEYATSTPVTVNVNGVAATVYGTALASGFVGQYQVAIQVHPFMPQWKLAGRCDHEWSFW